MKRVYHVPPLPERVPTGHKGTFGRLLVVGGSPLMLGAPVLAGTAALRTGAGWVQVAVEKLMLPAALSVTPELVGLPLSSTRASMKELSAAADAADALVVGPGMGLSTVARERLSTVLMRSRPTVIDADALTLLGRQKAPIRLPGRCVLTPHPGELPRLSKHFAEPVQSLSADEGSRMAWAVAASEGMGAVVVLKGARTVVASGRKVYIQPTVTSALAKAGTGDVLAGIIGTLLIQMPDVFDAAVLGVSLHAVAGVEAGELLGDRSVLARDVVAALPKSIAQHG